MTSPQSGMRPGSGHPKNRASAMGAPMTMIVVQVRCPMAARTWRVARGWLRVFGIGVSYGPAKPCCGWAVAVPVMVRFPRPKVCRNVMDSVRVMVTVTEAASAVNGADPAVGGEEGLGPLGCSDRVEAGGASGPEDGADVDGLRAGAGCFLGVVDGVAFG